MSRRFLPSPGNLTLGLGFLAVYLALNVGVPWPHLARTGGDFEVYHRAAGAIVEGQSPFQVHRFDYPPLLAFVLAPTALLSLTHARIAWFVLSQVCLVGAAWGTWRLLGGTRRALLIVGVLWCAGGTVQENLVLGQVSPLLLLLVVLGLVEYRRRAGRAAVLWGLAAALKVWPAVLLLAFVLRREWRGLLAGIASAAFLVLLPLGGIAVFLGPPYLPTSQGYWLGTPAVLNDSLPATALRLADPPTPGEPLPDAWVRGNNPEELELSPRDAALSAGVSVVLLALTVVAVGLGTSLRPAADPDPTAQGLTLAALLAATVLASPIAWYHYQLFQFPGLALLAATLVEKKRLWALVGLALVGLGLTRSQSLAFGPYVEAYGLTAANPPLLWLTLTLVPTLNLVFVVWLLREAGVRRRGSGETAESRQKT